MRLHWRSKKPVAFRVPDTSPENAEKREDQYVWGEAHPDMAAHQPDTSLLTATQFGDKAKRMRLMLYDGTQELAEGMGVCIFVPPEASCDYRILSTELWEGVQRARLEWIPEVKRG